MYCEYDLLMTLSTYIYSYDVNRRKTDNTMA